MVLQQHNFDFLKALAQNNNRDWFMANKDKYEAALENSIAFAEAVLQGLQSVDEIETVSGKKSLMRIYRDVRFSKDKTPYKNNWGGGFKRAGENRRGGFYFHIQPDNSFVGGGFWNPESADLKRIRQGISLRQNEFEKIVLGKDFKAVFGELHGEKLKTCPKGFDKEDPALKWLQHKQFIISRKFSDKEVMSPDYAKKVTETFAAMLPFFNIMTEFLTTSPDGESLI
jgi:uncharacterized protein (TIGR02453 family)